MISAVPSLGPVLVDLELQPAPVKSIAASAAHFGGDQALCGTAGRRREGRSRGGLRWPDVAAPLDRAAQGNRFMLSIPGMLKIFLAVAPADMRKSHDGLAGPLTHECHKNATDLVLAENSLIYCEGYALFQSGECRCDPCLGYGRSGERPRQHLVPSRRGLRWRAFQGSVREHDGGSKNRGLGSLLDDWQNNYPLRGDLGDCPAGIGLEMRAAGCRPN